MAAHSPSSLGWLSEEAMAALLDDAPVAIQGYDENHQVVYWNRCSTALYGWGHEEALGRRIEELIIPPEMQDLVATLIEAWVVRGEPIQNGPIELMHKDRSRITVHSVHTVVTDSTGRRLLYCTDIQLDNAAETAMSLSGLFRDPMTGLLNRESFLRSLTQVLTEPGERGALMMLDLNKFKQVNDLRGHAAGDTVLAHVGTRLTNALRSRDVIGRLGGDEFVLLVRCADPEQAESVARRVGEQLCAPIEVGEGEPATVGASIGVVWLGDHPTRTPAEHLAAGDAAMYEAKRGSTDDVRVAWSPRA